MQRLNALRFGAALVALSFAGILGASGKRDAIVAAAWQRLHQQTPCCAQLTRADFPSLVKGSHPQRAVLTLEHVRLFDNQPATFVGLELPRMEVPYYLEVRAVPKFLSLVTMLKNAHLVDPAIALLDSEFRVVRIETGFACMNSLSAMEEPKWVPGIVKIDPSREKYAVIFANPQGEGKTANLVSKPSFWGEGNWPVPFAPDGTVIYRMASPANARFVRDELGCKVPE